MYKKIFIISLVLLLASVFVSKYFLSSKQKGSIEVCDKLIEAGKTEEAVAALGDLIRVNPKDVSARMKLAALLEKKGDVEGAYGEYKKALEIEPENLTALNRSGFILRKQGKDEEALPLFESALKKDAGSVEALNGIGMILLGKGDTENALSNFDKALQADSSNADALAGKASALQILIEKGKSCAEKGMFDDALGYLNKANEKDKNNADVFVQRGILFFKKGEMEKGVKEFTDAIALKPKSADIYFSYGKAYIDRGMFYEGIQEMQKILEFSPKEMLVHYNIGLGFLKGGFGDVAVEEFKAEIEINPNHAQSHFNLGLAYSKAGKIEEAVKEYNKSLELDPSLVDAHYNLALIYAKNNKVEEAIKGFEKILAIKKDDVPAQYNLGILYAKSNQPDKAIEIFKNVINIDPNNTDARDNLAMLYENKAMFDDAIAQYEAILSVPNLASHEVVYNSLGTMYMKKGDLNKAKEAFGKAVEINPRYAQGYFGLGSVCEYNDKGERFGEGFDSQASMTNYQKAIEIDPNFTQAVNNLEVVTKKAGAGVAAAEAALPEDNKTRAKEHIVLGEIFYNKGELENARAEYNKALELDPENEEVKKNLAMVDQLQKSDAEKVDSEKRDRQIAEENEKNEAKKRQDIAALLESGQTLFSKEDYSGAVVEWQKILALDPSNEVALANIARAKDAMAGAEKAKTEEGAVMSEEARKLAEKEKALKDQEISKNLSTAKIYFEEGYYDEAVKTWEIVLQSDPANEEAKIGIEEAKAKLGTKEAAAEGKPAEAPAEAGKAAAPEAEEISPLKARLNAQRIEESLSTGDVLVKVGDIEEGIREYEKILKIDPNHKEALKRIKEAREGVGIALEKKKQQEDMKRFEQEKEAAEKEKTRKISEFLTSGEIKFNKGEFEEAVSIWNNIIAIDPTNNIARKKITEAMELKIAQDNRKKKEEEAKEFAKQKALVRIQEAQLKKKKEGVEGAPVARKAAPKKKLHVAKKRDAFLDEKYLEETLGSITGEGEEEGLPAEN